ncbi:MAG: glycosyltransferase family 4 protein [Chloroflexota bacterium]
MQTITIVSPWFGPDTVGGAETQARQLAQAIQGQGAAVEVWTTTGRDSFTPPTPYYAEGTDALDGIPIRRFPLTPPTNNTYVPSAVAQRLHVLPILPDFPDHEHRLLASLVSSDTLLEAIATTQAGRQFLFIPYPFPTSFWGTLLAGERANLLPCLHDEPYARYSTYRWMFQQARRVLSNSPAERDLARWLYDLADKQVVVAGEGIDLTPRGDGAAFRERHQIDGPLLLYVGRRDESKNVPLLLSYIREYWARRGSLFTLMLIGRDRLDLPPSLQEVVLDLGYCDVAEKHDAYAAADVFINPSTYESFSIVLMEAWLQETAALVHADCAVTREAAETSQGGLAFRDFGEFAAALDLLLANAALCQMLGRNGRAYVLDTCRWEAVAQRTIDALLTNVNVDEVCV